MFKILNEMAVFFPPVFLIRKFYSNCNELFVITDYNVLAPEFTVRASSNILEILKQGNWIDKLRMFEVCKVHCEQTTSNHHLWMFSHITLLREEKLISNKNKINWFFAEEIRMFEYWMFKWCFRKIEIFFPLNFRDRRNCREKKVFDEHEHWRFIQMNDIMVYYLIKS